jgi:AraC family transcriptional regulator
MTTPRKPSVSEPKAVESLLSTASATVTLDPQTARACTARALTLLRVETGPASAGDLATIPPRGGLSPRNASRVLAYIDSNLSQKIMIEELAVRTRLSASHFSRAFRTTFGVPPLVYVTHQRIQRAQELMLRTREPLVRIALQCGLCDQAHLSRMFRRVTGVPPAAWRRHRIDPTLN